MLTPAGYNTGSSGSSTLTEVPAPRGTVDRRHAVQRLDTVLYSDEPGAARWVGSADAIVPDGEVQPPSSTSTATWMTDAFACLAAFVSISETT